MPIHPLNSQPSVDYFHISYGSSSLDSSCSRGERFAIWSRPSEDPHKPMVRQTGVLDLSWSEFNKDRVPYFRLGGTQVLLLEDGDRYASAFHIVFKLTMDKKGRISQWEFREHIQHHKAPFIRLPNQGNGTLHEGRFEHRYGSTRKLVITSAPVICEWSLLASLCLGETPPAKCTFFESLHAFKEQQIWTRQPHLDERVNEEGHTIDLQVSALLGSGILPWEVWRSGGNGRPSFMVNGSRLYVRDNLAWDHLQAQLEVGVYSARPPHQAKDILWATPEAQR